jgi:hypothetical protein
MDLGVPSTEIIIVSKVGFGAPILSHDPSAFGLAYLISYVNLIAPLLVVSQSF